MACGAAWLFAGAGWCAVRPVGPVADGHHVVATGQDLHPAGDSLEFGGRPVDLVLSPDGNTLYVKDNRGLVVVDAAAWKIRQQLSFPEGGGSVHGILVNRAGSRIYVTTAHQLLWEAQVKEDGMVSWSRSLAVPGPGGKGNSHACGMALSPDERTLYVCLSRNNSLGVIDLESGAVKHEIDVGVAPFDVVLSPDGRTAYVSNWGGRHPRKGEQTAKSAGTDTLVDERGIAASGTVSFVDLEAWCVRTCILRIWRSAPTGAGCTWRMPTRTR